MHCLFRDIVYFVLVLKAVMEISCIRLFLEQNDADSVDEFPGNLTITGLISGLRVCQTDPDFREVSFNVTQGSNEELCVTYIGWYDSL